MVVYKASIIGMDRGVYVGCIKAKVIGFYTVSMMGRA
jgi:tetrahydromethanopterin S-methyltransferase subunit F